MPSFVSKFLITGDGELLIAPTSDGSAGQILQTDGNGQLSFTIPASNGMSDLIDDTTPQLGGNLDLNGFAIGSVTPTEFTYLSGVTSDIQTQLDGKADAVHTHTASDITDFDTEVSNNASVAANTSDISTNTGNISTNTSDISTNTGNISTNTSDISTNTGNISTNTGNIATNTSAIDGKADAVHTHTASDITDFDTEVSNNPTVASALQDVVDDTTPQLGGNLDVNGNSIVSASNGNISLIPDGTGNVVLGTLVFDGDMAVTSNEDDYVLTYDDSTGTVSLEVIPTTSKIEVKNDTAGTLLKGRAVHVTGSHSSGKPTIEYADSSSASTMNAIGIVEEDITAGGEGYITLAGIIEKVDTSSYTSGDTLYVGTSGVLTDTKPTGTSLIQNMGMVGRSHASVGSFIVIGSGRSNDIPNLPQDFLWLGNASGVATPTNKNEITELSDDTTPQLGGNLDAQSNDITSVGNLGIGTASPGAKLHATGSGAGDIFKLERTDANGFLEIDFTSQYTNYNSELDHVWKIGGTEYMRIDSSGNYTNTAASTQLFSGGVTNTFEFGRDTDQKLYVFIDDLDLTIDYQQDADGNSDHHFAIKNSGSGTGENDIQLWTGGSQRVTLLDNGNVGIGTTNPQSSVAVFTPAASSARENIIEATTGESTYSKFGLGNLTTSSGIFIPQVYGYNNDDGRPGFSFLGLVSNDVLTNNHGAIDLNSGSIPANSADPLNATRSSLSNHNILSVRNDGTQLFTIAADGNTGIGTTSPSAKLEVAGDVSLGAGDTITWGAGNGIIEAGATTDEMTFKVAISTDVCKMTSTALEMSKDIVLNNTTASTASASGSLWLDTDIDRVVVHHAGNTATAVARMTPIHIRPQQLIADSTSGFGITTRNQHVLAAFDYTTDEIGYYTGRLPDNYNGDGLTVVVDWVAATATTGDVVWNVAFERIAANGLDIDSDSFGADNTATDTCNATPGKVKYSTINFTDGADMDSVVAGETFRLRITRDADNGSDTMVGDAQILAIKIYGTNDFY
jgi:hypothetical protein